MITMLLELSVESIFE